MWRLLAVECDKIFPDCPRLPSWRGPVRLHSYYSLEAAGIGFDHARINGEALPANEARIHAAAHYSLEDMAEEIAITEATVPVLPECGVVGHLVFEPETAKMG
jgi:hypothetical protein